MAVKNLDFVKLVEENFKLGIRVHFIILFEDLSILLALLLRLSIEHANHNHHYYLRAKAKRKLS